MYDNENNSNIANGCRGRSVVLFACLRANVRTHGFLIYIKSLCNIFHGLFNIFCVGDIYKGCRILASGDGWCHLHRDGRGRQNCCQNNGGGRGRQNCCQNNGGGRGRQNRCHDNGGGNHGCRCSHNYRMNE